MFYSLQYNISYFSLFFLSFFFTISWRFIIHGGIDGFNCISVCCNKQQSIQCWKASLVQSKNLVCHHVCALIRVVRILMLPFSWWNAEERIGTLTLQEGVSITNGQYSVALYYEKKSFVSVTIYLLFSGTQKTVTEKCQMHKSFIFFCSSILNIFESKNALHNCV